MSSAPLMGDMAITNALNPPETTTSDVSNQFEADTPTPTTQTAPDPAQQTPAPSAPAPAAPAKPGLWKGVLMGALQGLAAGSAVNTRGMSSGGAFAAGAGAGANQVLNVNPQQKAELDQTKASTAIHWATLAKLQQDVHNAPQSRQEAMLDSAADDTAAMLKSGAVVPLMTPSDSPIDAQKMVQQMHAKDPWQGVYFPLPIKGADGKIQYTAVQFPKGPLQTELDIPSGMPGVPDFTMPAGTPGDQVGKAYAQWKDKVWTEQNKANIAKGNQGTRVDVQKLKNLGALDVQGLKNQGAADRAASKPSDLSFATSPDGRQIAGSPAELAASGIDPKNITKLPGTEAQKVVVARQLIGPRKGLFDLVNKDIDDLSQQGKLGVAASRWGEFMSGKVGDGPEFQALRTHMGLLSTALMQAHVGARGSKDMLQHFKELANYSISNEATLRKALQSEWEYVNEKAMLPAGNPVNGRSGPGQTAPSAGSNSGKSVSLAAAKQLPSMRGMTDDQITAAIKAQGHTVTP